MSVDFHGCPRISWISIDSEVRGYQRLPTFTNVCHRDAVPKETFTRSQLAAIHRFLCISGDFIRFRVLFAWLPLYLNCRYSFCGWSGPGAGLKTTVPWAVMASMLIKCVCVCVRAAFLVVPACVCFSCGSNYSIPAGCYLIEFHRFPRIS